jgi:lysophospholipase L1-like esterase
VGDSLTAQGDWQAAFPDRVVFNQGVSGDTSFQLMLRLPAIRQTGAGTFLVMVGINDIALGYAPEGIASRIQWLRTGLQLGSGARVIVQSTIPCARFSCGSEGVRRVEELNRLLARRIPPEDFVDLTPVMADADGLRSAYTVDGVHLNAAGYARWQGRLRELGLP